MEEKWFSSPYGDGIDAIKADIIAMMFSPPLRGLYTKYITKHRKTEEPEV